MMTQRDKMKILAIKSGNMTDWKEYCSLRNQERKGIRKRKEGIFKINELKDDGKGLENNKCHDGSSWRKHTLFS